VVRAPWGGGATIAEDPADAMRLLDARRRSAGPEQRVRAGIVDHVDGLATFVLPAGPGLACTETGPRRADRLATDASGASSTTPSAEWPDRA
jgi:hypothetical protein